MQLMKSCQSLKTDAIGNIIIIFVYNINHALFYRVNFGSQRDKPQAFTVGAGVTFTMSRQLQYILEMNTNVVNNSARDKGVVVTPPISKELSAASIFQQNIYVTCDQIQESFVNGQVFGVLANIQVHNDLEFGDHVITDHKPKYFRWLANSMNKIEIKFCDEFLHVLRMRYGHSFALLHFRQCQN